MFDFMRDRGSTVEEKRLEAIGAYLDNALTAAERERFERQLAGDAGLSAELEQMRTLKMQMRAMPRRRVPRSFALDPALYGRPKSQPLMRAYPILRGATALTAFFLIFTLALGAFRGQFAGGTMSEAVPQTVMIEAAQEEAADAELAQEAGPIESPAEAPAAGGAEDRIRPTMEASEPAENLETESLALPVEGTAAPEAYDAPPAVPESGLSIEATTTAAEPTVEEFAGDVAQLSTETAEEGTTMSGEGEIAAEGGDDGTILSLLRPLQIGLAVVFLLSLILLLMARRRSSSF